MHWWAQQHKKPWTSTEDNSGVWSEDPLHPFHNIQPSEEHSPGGTCVKVYNQEKTWSKYRGFTTRCRLDFSKKHLKKDRQTTSAKGRLELRSTCTRMLGRSKYGGGLEQLMIKAYNIICETWWSMHGFQWHWVTGVYWWRDRGQKQPDEFWSL